MEDTEEREETTCKYSYQTVKKKYVYSLDHCLDDVPHKYVIISWCQLLRRDFADGLGPIFSEAAYSF